MCRGTSVWTEEFYYGRKGALQEAAERCGGIKGKRKKKNKGVKREKRSPQCADDDRGASLRVHCSFCLPASLSCTPIAICWLGCTLRGLLVRRLCTTKHHVLVSCFAYSMLNRTPCELKVVVLEAGR